MCSVCIVQICSEDERCTRQWNRTEIEESGTAERPKLSRPDLTTAPFMIASMTTHVSVVTDIKAPYSGFHLVETLFGCGGGCICIASRLPQIAETGKHIKCKESLSYTWSSHPSAFFRRGKDLDPQSRRKLCLGLFQYFTDPRSRGWKAYSRAVMTRTLSHIKPYFVRTKIGIYIITGLDQNNKIIQDRVEMICSIYSQNINTSNHPNNGMY